MTIKALNSIVLVGYRNKIQITETPSTVNIYVSALRSWGEVAQTAGLPGQRSGGPAQTCETRQRCPATRFTFTQVNALLRETQHNRYPMRDHAILQLLVQTGMRIGKYAALCYGDITFGENGTSDKKLLIH